MTPYELRLARERVRLELAAGSRPPAEAHHELETLSQQLLGSGEPEPLAQLARRLGADRRAEDFLSYVLACGTDPVCAASLLRMQGASGQHGAAVASYAAVCGAGDEARALALALATDHPLVRAHILESRSDPAIVPALRLWSVDPRVAQHLAGNDAMTSPLRRVEVPPVALYDDAQRRQLEELTQLLATERPLLLVLEGPTGSGRATAIAMAAQPLGRATALLAIDQLDRSPEALEAGLRTLRREQALTGAIAVIRGLEELDGPDETPRRRRLERFLAGISSPLVITTALGGQSLRLGGELVRATWAPPPAASRRNMWNVLLALADEAHAVTELELDELGHRYSIGVGEMQEAITGAQLGAGALSMGTVVSSLRQRTAERLTGLTTHVPVRQDWSDLVLAPDTRSQIDGLISRVRHSHQVLERWGLERRVGRATGVAALFSGPPGTGKTMVAGLVARELGLDLHQIELSQVLSKWIGETEKQLAKIFDAAGTGHCLLLFDEADALFTKRTEVKSSNDRYSNLEVNFLLQRMEAFRGIVILTTNLDASMDPAFKRRLASHVVFWPPDEDERARLWRSYLTSGLPLEGDLDIEHLAAAFPDLSGAHIRNAVLGAAFAAASKNQHVGQADLESAARSEYATMGRVLSRDRAR